MNRTAIFLILVCAPAALAAEAPKVPACVAPPSADYIPGIDATGRAVAPADLASQPPLDLGTITVVPRVAVPNNKIVKDAEVVVDLKKLAPAPNCPPAPAAKQNPQP